MAKISIIVPVYNAEKYIDRCFNSLLNQTFNDIEVIFVDDCSTDKSCIVIEEKIRKNDLSNFHILKHNSNLGVATARNTGLAFAKGEFIGWLDIDDWIEPILYEKLYTHISKDQSDIAWCDIIFEYGEYSKTNIQKTNGTVEDLIDKTLSILSFGSLWNKLFRNSIIKSHGIAFCDQANMMEDRAFLLKYFCYCKKASYVKGAYYHYNQYGSGTMTIPDEKSRMRRLEESYANIKSLRDFSQTSIFDEDKFRYWNGKLDILELIVKQHLLYSTKLEDYKLWGNYHSEHNNKIWRSPELSFKHKMVGTLINIKAIPLLRLWLFLKKLKRKLQ